MIRRVFACIYEVSLVLLINDEKDCALFKTVF